MKTHFAYFFAIVISTAQQAGCQLKRYNLSMLHVIPLVHPGCVPAVNIVINNVNSRKDVLPDYNIVSDMRHEEDFFAGWAPVRELVRYSRSWENRQDDGLIRSPVYVGPFFSIGCKAYGRVLKFFNMVSIAMACHAPYLADKIAYPNMYNVQGNGEQNMLSLVHFIKQIGGWSKMGILSIVDSPQDYAAAVNLQRFASQSGIFIPSFNVVMDITDDAINELLFHDIRIIAVMITQPTLTWRFLCKAWLAGMKGSRYLFFMMNVMAGEPSNIGAPSLPDPWCNAEIVREQIRNAIFIGPAIQAIDESRVTELGYNVSQFEDRVEAIMRRPRNATVGSLKQVCHDATIMAVFALQDADNRLKKEFNMSLRDMNTNPEFVMKVFNESVLNANVSGLRTQLRFSKRGFSDNDRVIYTYYNPRGYRNKYYTMEVENARPEMVYGKYQTYAFEPWDWAAWKNDGKPPRDRAFQVQIIEEVRFEISIVIFILAGIAVVVQIILLLVTIKNRNKSIISPILKIFGYLGCIALNGVALCYGVQTTPVLAAVRLCVLVFSVSIITGIGSIRAYCTAAKLSKRSKPHRNKKSGRVLARKDLRRGMTGPGFAKRWENIQPSPVNSRSNSPDHGVSALAELPGPIIDSGQVRNKAPISGQRSVTRTASNQIGDDTTANEHVAVKRTTSNQGRFNSALTNPQQIPLVELEKGIEKKTLLLTISFISVNAIYVAAWLPLDSFGCRMVEVNWDNYYDLATDTQFNFAVLRCASWNNQTMALCLLVFHVAVLIFGIYRAYRVKQGRKNLVTECCSESPGIIGVPLNTLSLLLCACIVIFSLEDVNNQRLAVALGSIILSSTTSLCFGYKLIPQKH